MRFQNGSNKVVIELRVVQFWSEIIRVFNYHFIRSILKSHNFMALNLRFWCNVPSRAGLLEIAEPETRLDILFSLQNDVM